MSNNITVTVTLDDRKITLEGPEEFVTAEVRRLTSASPAATGHQLKAQESSNLALSERELVNAKSPKNQPEIVAVLAFCLTEKGQTEFNEADIKKAYVRAGVRPPKVIAQAIRDARNNFDYIEAGSKRGYYTLSSHGDRTVRFDLPRDKHP